MKKRVILVVLALLILSSFSLVSASEIFFKGDVNFRINDSYNAGDEIETMIQVSNNENFPIADAYLILEIVEGCESPVYPSQDSDCDNVFYEEVISDINIPVKSNLEIPFKYKLPVDLKEGEYRVDAFLRTKKTPIVGVAHIHLPGTNKNFKLEGNGTFPETKISRTKTNIDNVTGPIGVGKDPGQEFDLEVYFNSSLEKDNLTDDFELAVEICKWEDSKCDKISEEKEDVNISNEKKIISMNAPENPGAYAIRIEILNEDRTVSIYRSRLIVHGETAKIRKMYPDKYYYDNENATISFLIGGSPDHYTYPTVRDIELEATIENLDNGEKLTKRENINNITPEKGFVNRNLTFEVGKMSKFEICGTLRSEGEKYDEYCYEVDSDKFAIDENIVKLVEEYEEDYFKGKLCLENKVTGILSSSRVFVLVKKEDKVIKNFEEEISGCRNMTFGGEKGNYTIIAQDKNSNKEFKFDIGIGKDRDRKNEIGTSHYIYYLAVIIIFILIITISIILIKILISRKNEK